MTIAGEVRRIKRYARSFRPTHWRSVRQPGPGFFDGFPRFFETSRTTPVPNRLNKRYLAIFQTLPGIVSDARVLDIASHDGRRSFAALKSGARHVTGVEARGQLVASARETFLSYGCESDTFRFVQDDIFHYLRETKEQFDAVLCLGFFYHTYRHPELMALIARCAPKVLIIDTRVGRIRRLACTVRREKVDLEKNAAADETGHLDEVYVAVPSLPLLKDLVTHFGYSHQESDWPGIIGRDGNREGIIDYVKGRRVTLICQRSD